MAIAPDFPSAPAKSTSITRSVRSTRSSQIIITPNNVKYWALYGTKAQERGVRVTGLRYYVDLARGYRNVVPGTALLMLLDVVGAAGMLPITYLGIRLLTSF